MKLITLHLPEAYIRGLDSLVPEFYPNRAEAIRVAVRDMLIVEAWGRKIKPKPECPNCHGEMETGIGNFLNCKKCGTIKYRKEDKT